MKARRAEIAWLLAIALLGALGGARLLPRLQAMPVLGSAVLALAVVGAIVMVRRAYDPASPTVRADVTKAVTYCVAAVLGLVAVAGRQHWAIGSCIVAFEVAVIFDIITIASGDGGTQEQR